jgi:1-acyl-sn-glycerol-3-phosphate acyltransferase
MHSRVGSPEARRQARPRKALEPPAPRPAALRLRLALPAPARRRRPEAATGIVVEAMRELWERLNPDLVRDADAEIAARLQRMPTRVNEYGYDPWGLNIDTARRALVISTLLYRYYFRVETHGLEHLPDGRVLVISNHAGQVAIDAAMIGTATVLEREPPRIVRGMGEYWLPTVPWVNELMVRTGSVVGTRKNCIDLLENEEAVIAFPEGVRGMNKLVWDRYQLQEFGHGFMRLALETNAPTVPIAVVGSEEQAPAIANLRPLGRLLRMPAFPVTLTWPWLGPLGLLPLPVKYRIYFGEPMHFTGNPSDEDEVIEELVAQVKARIAAMLAAGLGARRSLFW